MNNLNNLYIPPHKHHNAIYNNKKNIKNSIGIACCKKNKILLVCRRISYAYLDLVLGKYNIYNLSKIKHMFNNMTAREHCELLTKNFDRVWWDATHLKLESQLYESKKRIFTDVFGDEFKNGRYDISNIIKESTPIHMLWEIPKGKAKNCESDINAAVREFKEETNIDKKKYHIIFKPINYSYEENNTIYSINYYPAALIGDHIPKIATDNPAQTYEICDIRWMDLQTIKNLCSNRLYKLSVNIISVYRAFLKLSNTKVDAQQSLRIAEFRHRLNSEDLHKDDFENQTDNNHDQFANIYQ